MEPAIVASGITKAFGTRKALDEVSFELPQGAFLSIFGPNGAGKTTLLRILSTLSRATAGSAHLLGIDSKQEPDEVRDRIGFISHESMLYPDLTAEENLLFTAHLYGVENPEKRVEEMLDVVELSYRRLDQVRTFSRGMTQRLSIARALIHDPALVFLDEPYSGLDPRAVEVFDGLLAQMREERTFVMVSHDLQKGFAMGSHVLVLAKGKVQIFAQKESLEYEAFSRSYAEIVGMGVA